MTLWITSVIVFLVAQILPGDVARTILGQFADQRSVDLLNHELGADRPAIAQYWDWISGFVQGDFGTSYQYRTPSFPLVRDALGRSLELAAVALAITLPLAVAGGVAAALAAGRPLDRIVTTVGAAGTVIPEFVSGIVAIVVFGIGLNVLPIAASWPEGASLWTQVYHLILPALPLTLVLFGYLARLVRAGTLAGLRSDYTRTAYMKGLRRRTVVTRHVLPNALPPTIIVLASQVPYLIGGLVVIEILFNYQGIGLLIYNAARAKDFPMLESATMTVAVVYMAAALAADLAYAALNPRIRLGDGR